MTELPELSTAKDLLLCPRCQSPLFEGNATDSLGCKPCGVTFPQLSGIPVLFSHPEDWTRRWSEGLSRFVSQMNYSEKQLLVELLEGDLGERAQSRVRQVIAGLGQHRDEVASIMQDAGIAPGDPSQAPPPGDYSPETYFTLIHRDYAWAPEVDEVTVSWERLLKVLPSGFRCGRTLMLGAGTGRLAWQMAAEWPKDGPIIAIDINPLPFLITSRLLSGEELSLTELPAHPRRSSVAAMTRALKAPLPPPTNLQLLFADGLAPPVVRGAFDTVVTPWFVDQVPEDAARIPELVSELLRDGGSFICTGPFLYDAGHTKPSRRYCADEFIEHVSRSGFEVTAASYQPEPYVASPLSTQGRIEHVLYMHARKVSPVPRRRKELPPYLLPGEGASLPVPVPSGLSEARFAEPAVAAVASLIDGTRTVLQMTGLLIERGVLADDGTADAAVRGCLKLIVSQLQSETDDSSGS